jgi:tetrahydromethanopterin S-methyltransferase subunit B
MEPVMPDAVNPYAPSTAPLATGDARVSHENLGGLTRQHYFFGWLGMVVLAFIPLLGIVNLIISPVLACYRMKNVGYHPALGLLILVPIANIWAGLICLAAPTGYRYSKKLDTTGKVIMGILIGLIVLVILAAILAPLMAPARQ